MQDQSKSNNGKFVQPPQLIWLAMNVLLTLIKPNAMAALLEGAWPSLVNALLQESGRPSQHMWMVMGCLRTVLQVLGAQVPTPGRQWSQKSCLISVGNECPIIA